MAKRLKLFPYTKQQSEVNSEPTAEKNVNEKTIKIVKRRKYSNNSKN